MGITEKAYILAGVTPMKSVGMAKYMKSKVPGMDVPDEIVKAYRDITEIKVRHYRDLAPALKRANTKKKILETAKELHGKNLDGKQVITALKAATEQPRPNKSLLASYETSAGAKMLSVSKKGRGGLSIAIESGASKEELKKALDKVVEELYS